MLNMLHSLSGRKSYKAYKMASSLVILSDLEGHLLFETFLIPITSEIQYTIHIHQKCSLWLVNSTVVSKLRDFSRSL